MLLVFNHLSGASTVSVLLNHASGRNVNPPIATLARVSFRPRESRVGGGALAR